MAEFVKRCEDCQLQKVPREAPSGKLGYRYINGPWTNVTGDVMGPFPSSHKQTRYVILFTDQFTKYIEARPIAKANGSTILKAFEELVIFRHGCPKVWITDNGTEFANQSVDKRLAELGITRASTPPYHAQSNPTESYNQTVKTMIRIFVKEDHQSWDEHLHEFVFAVNTAVNAATKVSPAFLNHARDLIPPSSLKLEHSAPTNAKSWTTETWTNRLKSLPAMQDLIREQLDLAHIKAAKYYNQHRVERTFEVGDIVARVNNVLSSGAKKFAAKLAPKYSGPCTILRKISDLVYEISDSTNGKEYKVHVSNLNPFYVPNNVQTNNDISITAHQNEQQPGRDLQPGGSSNPSPILPSLPREHTPDGSRILRSSSVNLGASARSHSAPGRALSPAPVRSGELGTPAVVPPPPIVQSSPASPVPRPATVRRLEDNSSPDIIPPSAAPTSQQKPKRGPGRPRKNVEAIPQGQRDGSPFQSGCPEDPVATSPAGRTRRPPNRYQPPVNPPTRRQRGRPARRGRGRPRKAPHP